MKNLEALLRVINNLKADAAFIMSDQNRFWAIEFPSSEGLLSIKKDGSVDFLLDGRYIEKAKATIKDENVNIIPYDIDKYVKTNKIVKVAIESEYTTYKTMHKLQEYGLEIISFSSIPMRNIKTKYEIDCIKKAIKICEEAFNSIVKKIQPGVTEEEVGKMLLIKFIELGADGPSFPPIVASGPNGAYPHHGVSDRKIKDGEFVTIDFGCVYKGYCSDITRTILIGKEPRGRAAEVAKYYEIVKEAQRLGIEAIKEGMTGKQIDDICRNYIRLQGFDYAHGTGHGLGIEIHEEPYVRDYNREPFLVGNVVTIEPGIYVPGIGGVRIEDDILVGKNKSEVLSKDIIKK